MRKVLFIAHYFPPTGGAGVQRSVKFVKYLPKSGFLPIVLTGSPKAPDRWTPEDASLASEVPASVPVYRTAAMAMDPGEAPSKSVQAERVRAVLVELGSQIIAEHKPGLIFVTMSPFDHTLVAAELARRHGLPWVADLRDPWALDEFQVHRSRWHRAHERRLMGERLSSAASVIMNTAEAQRKFQNAFPELAAKAVVSITNGFDPADFEVEPKVPVPGKFNLVHSGYFHADLGLTQRRRAFEYRVLGRTEPGVRLLPRSHFYLLRALERWVAENPAVKNSLAVTCLGVASRVDQSLVDASSCASLVRFTGYKPHAECLSYVKGADLLFLPMHAMPHGRRATIVPGKTYEYMASGRPILAAVPESDARDFLQSSVVARICDPENVIGMVAILKELHEQWKEGGGHLSADETVLKRFHRAHLAELLASEFARVVRNLQSPSSGRC